jgi:hypothetical protein
MHRRPTFAFALAGWLLTAAIAQPVAAFAQRVPPPADDPADVLPEAPPRQPTLWDKWVTGDSAAYGTGALIGIVAFNVYLAPIAAAAGATSLRSWLGTRVVATTMAATGGVLTTYAYDRWANRPVDTTYFWSRAGAVAGVGIGSMLLAGLGYPPATALVRYSPQWVANRAFLLGSGVLGESLTYIWLRRGETTPSP